MLALLKRMQRKINNVKNDLPSGVDEPIIPVQTIFPILKLSTFGSVSETELL